MKQRSSQHKPIRTFAEDSHSIVLTCMLFIFQRLTSFYHLLTCIYLCLCLSLWPAEARRGQQIPRTGDPGGDESVFGCWDLNSGPLPVQQNLPASEWSFQPPLCFLRGGSLHQSPRVALCSRSPCLSLAGSTDNVMYWQLCADSKLCPWRQWSLERLWSRWTCFSTYNRHSKEAWHHGPYSKHTGINKKNKWKTLSSLPTLPKSPRSNLD